MKIFFLQIAGDPVAKGRPRAQIRHHTDGVAFPKMLTPEKTKTAERVIWAEFKNRYPGSDPIDEPFALTLAFHEGPTQRDQDLDNMVKLVMDALNAHAWTDDRLCVCLTATVVRDAAMPRTEILAQTLAPSEQSSDGLVAAV